MFLHLPILVVALPLISAPLCLLFRTTRQLQILSLLVGGILLIICLVMLLYTNEGHLLRYDIGNWDAPFGIAYQVDQLNALIAFLFSIIFFFVFIYMLKSFSVELVERALYPIYSALFITQAGFMGVVLTDDLFNIYVFLEMASLASYALTAAKGQAKDVVAAYRYLLLGTVGAVFLLIGIAYLYLLSGTLNLTDMSERLPPLLNSKAGVAALAFISIGLFLKIAIFPLHLWLPRVYTYATSPISALLSGVSSKVALYLLVRLFFDTFNIASMSLGLEIILLVLGTLSILVCSLIALCQNNLKRMMAYSSIAQIGYIVLGIALLTPAGITAGVLHIFNHAIIKCMMFMAIGCIVYRIGSCTVADIRGLANHMPWTAGALVIGGFALVGVPLSSGFISKWYLVSAALETNAWLPVVVVVLGSLMSLAYVWRLIEAAYFGVSDKSETREAPPIMLGTVYVLLAIIIYVGVNPSSLINVCLAIGHQLLGF